MITNEKKIVHLLFLICFAALTIGCACFAAVAAVHGQYLSAAVAGLSSTGNLVAAIVAGGRMSIADAATDMLDAYNARKQG